MLEKIIDFISAYQEIDKESINADSQFIRDMSMNSIDIMQMCCQLEEDYGIEIDNKDMYTLQTVGEVAEYIKHKVED